jgi:hypothetical protein
MAFDFPLSPTIGQQYTPVAGTTYVFNGVGWTLAVSAVPGTWVLLDTKVASNSASLDFTSNITSLYDEYMFVGHGIAPASALGFDYYMYFSTDGGSTWNSSLVYGYVGQLNNYSGTAAGSSTGNYLTTVFSMTIGQGAAHGIPASPFQLSFEVKLYKPASAMYKNFSFNVDFVTNDGYLTSYVGNGLLQITTAINGIRFIRSDAGNIAVGTVSMYGRAK